MSPYPVNGRRLTGAMVVPEDDISPQSLLRFLSGYVCEECVRICIFIREVCGPELCRADYVWINEQLKACVQAFSRRKIAPRLHELRYLQMRTEYLLAVDGLPG